MSRQDIFYAYFDTLKKTVGVEGNSLYFDFPMMYSYGPHFPLCKWTRDDNGDVVYLVNNTPTTPTTSKQRAALIAELKQRELSYKLVDGIPMVPKKED